MYVRLPKHPFASIARMVKVKSPAAVGVPESTPADVSVRPSGSAPLLTVNVCGAVPPVAVLGARLAY